MREYFAKRVDRNQAEIVDCLRKLGFYVEILHEFGKGLTDLLVAKHGLIVMAEVKDGLKPPSAREFTPSQRRWHFSFPGMRCVLTCKADVMRFSKQFTAIAGQIREHKITLHVTGSEERMYEPRLY